MATLRQALEGLSSADATIDYWVSTPVCEDSEVRIGQLQLENGGLLDDKVFIGTLEQLHDSLSTLVGDESTRHDDEDFEYEWKIAADMLIDDLKINWKHETMTGCMHCGHPRFTWVDAETRACSKHCAEVLKGEI